MSAVEAEMFGCVKRIRKPWRCRRRDRRAVSTCLRGYVALDFCLCQHWDTLAYFLYSHRPVVHVAEVGTFVLGLALVVAVPIGIDQWLQRRRLEAVAFGLFNRAVADDLTGA